MRGIPDKQLFQNWYYSSHAFGRRAFEGPCHTHCNLEGFYGAIHDTYETLEKPGESIAIIKNKRWRTKMQDVKERLKRVSDATRDNIVRSESGNLTPEEGQRNQEIIDNERDEIIGILDSIWLELGLEARNIPTRIAIPDWIKAE